MKQKLFKNVFTLWSFASFAGIASALFYIFMAQFLTVEQYSLLYSLVAFSYILTIPQETIRTIIARICCKFTGQNGKRKIKFLFIKFLKQMFLFGIIAFVIFIFLIPYLKLLFKTTFLPLFILGIALVFAFLVPITWGILQGLFRFKQLGLNNSVEMIFKLIIAVALVAILPMQFKVIGAIIAIPASLLLTFVFGLIPIRDILKEKKKKFKEEGTSRYALASLTLFTLVAVMYSVDVILARYFFTEKVSGWYGGLSMIGKSLFFVAMNAKRVMLPSVAKEEKHVQQTRKTLAKTALLIGGLFLLFFIVSIFFPKTVIMIFLGSKYLTVIPYLKWMVLAFAFFSLANLLVFYNLSINKNKKISARILASGTFMQIALLIIFHSTLMQFISMVLVVNAVMFFLLLFVSLKKQ